MRRGRVPTHARGPAALRRAPHSRLKTTVRPFVTQLQSVTGKDARSRPGPRALRGCDQTIVRGARQSTIASRPRSPHMTAIRALLSGPADGPAPIIRARAAAVKRAAANTVAAPQQPGVVSSVSL